MDEPDTISRFTSQIKDPELTAAIRITSRVLISLQKYAYDAGFVQIMPVMLSPLTDPLNHAVYPAELEYEGRRLKLTASMIFHKQLALALLGVDKIFVVSPNIRLELSSVKSSANHLLEFSQFDIEMLDATSFDVMKFIESTVKYVFDDVRESCATDLKTLRRNLPDFQQPFPIYASEDLRKRHGDDFERCISEESTTPCFLTNFKREFYDRETPGQRGHYNNFDLIYPHGYGEALSGAEREFQYDQIMYRMRELDMNLTSFDNYLVAAQRGLIPQTAGAGLGIQRMVRFLCGRKEIKDVCLFDRSVASEFVF